MHPEINVVVMNNPFGVKGSINPNKDGSYTIIIDAHLSFEEQQKVYKHEYDHIISGDFDKSNADEIELDAHDLKVTKEFCPAL